MRPLAALLAAVTLVRLVIAAVLPLAPDETYYWIWSHALAGGYLDHPPMVALWIWMGTALAGPSALGVRLFGPVAGLLGSFMLFDAGRVLFPGTKAGIVAAALLNASLLMGVGTVVMTPDSPLLLFWTATLWAAARLAAGGPPWWWLVAGVAGGLALDSKYTALFLWIGIGLWVLLVPSVRPWLRRWHPWAACLIGLALFAPVLAWNATHAWAGLLKQGGRVQDWRPSRAIGFLAELVGGQIGLLTPWVWGLYMAGLAACIRRWRDPGWALLACLSVPPVLVFLQHALGDRVQGNWPAIIYPALSLAVGGLAVRRWRAAAALGFAITAIVYGQAATGVIPLPARLDPISMQLGGWDGLARQVDAVRAATGADFVAADGYAVSGELAWRGLPMIASGPRWALLSLHSARARGRIGILVGSTDPPDPAAWRDPRPVGVADRSGVQHFVLYRVIAETDGVALPRR